MSTISEIKKEIKSKPICFVYQIKSKKFKLVIKADKKSEAKKDLLNLINKKKIKPDDYFILMKLTFHSGTRFGQAGVLAAVLSVYKVEDGILKNMMNVKDEKYDYVGRNMIGPVWFKKYWLEENGWSYKYLDNIVNRLITGKANIIKIAPTSYNAEFLKKI
jgi:hypothetical protein